MIFTKIQMEVLKETKEYVKDYMDGLNDISHDYSHIKLVIRYSMRIARMEGIRNPRSLFHITMGALLHDIGDHKYSNENQVKVLRKFLRKFGDLKRYDKEEIIRIASNVSLSKEDGEMRNRKLDVVKDADRINSLGAIGIMRYVSYNIINNERPSFKEIIGNIRRRTRRIMRYLRTKSGREIARKHQNLVSLFLNNYRDFS